MNDDMDKAFENAVNNAQTHVLAAQVSYWRGEAEYYRGKCEGLVIASGILMALDRDGIKLMPNEGKPGA